jgi:hypothetical protein
MPYPFEKLGGHNKLFFVGNFSCKLNDIRRVFIFGGGKDFFIDGIIDGYP